MAAARATTLAGPRRVPLRAGRLVLIVSSTGGPRALARVLPALPDRLGAGTVIVQHMPGRYTPSLAARLDDAGPLEVREAVTGDEPSPRCALVAPGGRHLRFDAAGRVALCDDPPIGGLRPRADLAIADAVAVWGSRVLLVVLTGMGDDGLEGARTVRAAGGRVIVQAASGCTVYGMPRAIATAHLAHREVALQEMADAIATEARR